MEKEKADGLFEEMTAFLSENTAVSEAGMKDADDDGLPYESFEDFSTEPVEFSELAERMLRKVENLFDLTAVYNRHSEKYLKACVLLEKGIKFLGSACLTKIALEHREYTFPELSQLSTMKLYRMASFNYRKLDAALTEKLEKGNDLYPELLHMEFRYFNLLRRLRSTETKIYNYHLKKYYGEENYDPVIEGNAFTGDSWTKRYTQDREEAPAFRNAPAFPMILENQKSEIRNQRLEKCAERKAESEKKASDQSIECKVQIAEENSIFEKGAECKAENEVNVSAFNSDESVSYASSLIPNSEEVPAFAGIIERVVKRSGENEDGRLSFTYDEIEQLADDPEFYQYDPDMAAYLRQIREKIPNST